ncbi:MAG TPA: carbon-nitrogen hydrolase, partial [Bacteroidia bacterium]|nr:carbon-nitrogen hydrolase [Bacteroidia bacterium]
MKKIKVRRLRLEDYEAVTQIQLKCFPNMKPWSQEQFNSLLKHFKEGQIGVELDGKLV